MISYKSGDMLSSNAEALVNTVNTVGVMGKGIALQFKHRFPENYEEYRVEAKADRLAPGKMFVHELPGGLPRLIVNFPTKMHWRRPSQIEWIESGLQDLRKVIRELEIKSIAIPALGCGHGGLDWDVVRPMMEQSLSDLMDVDIEIYDPGSSRIAEAPFESESKGARKRKKSRSRKAPSPGQQELFGMSGDAGSSVLVPQG